MFIQTLMVYSISQNKKYIYIITKYIKRYNNNKIKYEIINNTRILYL